MMKECLNSSYEPERITSLLPIFKNRYAISSHCEIASRLWEITLWFWILSKLPCDPRPFFQDPANSKLPK